MEGLVSTFHIDWKLILAQIFNFGLVFAALYLLAAKPLKKLIEDRTEEITTGLMNAKQNAEILVTTEKEYKEIVAKARTEADKIFKESKKEAIMKKNEMLEEARNEVQAMITTGKKSLEAEKVKMVAEAKKEIIDLVIKTTEKVVGTQVTPAFNDKVVQELNSL